MTAAHFRGYPDNPFDDAAPDVPDEAVDAEVERWTSTQDRRVHARLVTGAEVVRYNRAGKWYIEKASDGVRSRIGISDAVALAVIPHTEVFYGLPGGSTFDARMRAALADLEAKGLPHA